MNTGHAFLEEGIAALRTRDLDGAAAAFAKAVRMDAGDSEARYHLANAY